MNKKIKNFVICLMAVFIMIGSSRFATNYYVTRTHIEPLSKNASLLTLLFMSFILLGLAIGILLKVIEHKLGNKNVSTENRNP
ncbi:hypothetical protein CN692_02250 [Bacillus sp. AFS002410]|uniref:hypothetical protein n=1 Tax=Bacillus sp. AFS002410 TaxID=2033481 RepID=UPI000BF14FA7|nr:hypothetical protein [Bacillus sp. AFS002410]PEJ60134.1 hypothetical protein CN692_02250 [Bacillus sp. AFS002410]